MSAWFLSNTSVLIELPNITQLVNEGPWICNLGHLVPSPVLFHLYIQERNPGEGGGIVGMRG